jgi:hypothetical protein
MDWKGAEAAEGGAVKIPDRWLYLYYYEALNILFRFENALRVFVYVILKKELQDGWDNAAIADGATIRTETKKRLTQAKEHGYLGYEVSSPMMYLNSGELTQIIGSDAYWKRFAPYFKATRAVLLTKLQEIGTIRNSLAHFRPLKLDDIDLIKQNSKHVLLAVEDCLVQLTSISHIVPTNSELPWYKELKPIGNEHLTTSLFFSRDQKWVRVELAYKIPTLQKTQYGDKYFGYLVGNIRTSQIVSNYAAIRKNCIYISEQSMFGTLEANYDVSASKKISIVFSQATFEGNLAQIASEIKDVALKIQAESSLVAEDHLARGELVEAKRANATYRELQNGHNYWQLDVDNLETPLAEVEEVEFWGQRMHFEDDFISATSHYPWMPSSVSKPSWSF